MKWNDATMCFEARCPDCGKVAGFFTYELYLDYQNVHGRRPVLGAVRHECEEEA